MAGVVPDWKQLMREAQPVPLAERDGYVYLVADPHLGDERAPPDAFVRMLRELPQPRMVILLGDVFKVWLAPPKFWDAHVRQVMAALQQVRARGVPVVMIVGNRDYFVPTEATLLRRYGLPFDEVVPGAMVLRWAGRQYGLTHGDLANRHDLQYLRWRRLSRSAPFERLFRFMPGPLARLVARRLEHSLASSNQAIKVSYPEDEVAAFARAVTPGLHGFFIGHFHLDRTVQPAMEGAPLRIVPDWFSSRQVLQLAPEGTSRLLRLPETG